VGDVIVITKGEAVQSGVSVRTQLTDCLPRIRGRRVQLQQVLLNLVTNAIQAMSDIAEGVRELHISTENTVSNGVHVAVRDTGAGLTPESLQRLFQPL
jgi:C4-dicarboxylate-specific signal transduction histidine kinase